MILPKSMPKTLRPLLLLLLPVTCGAQLKKQLLPAPDLAYVTIYSHSLTLTSFVPGAKNGIYSGRIFDGDHLLAHLGPNRFITFAIPPGSHTFAANCLTCKTSKGGGTATLDVQAGHHYFLQASMHISVTASGMAFNMNEVPCADAQSANQKSTAVEEKDIHPEGKPLTIADTTFPPCPTTTPEPQPQPQTKPKWSTPGE